MHYSVNIDRETGERAGAGGTFQVESIFDENGNDVTEALGVDVGHHYFEKSELVADIAKVKGVSEDELSVSFE
jgi:hypothetical protein